MLRKLPKSAERLFLGEVPNDQVYGFIDVRMSRLAVFQESPGLVSLVL